MISYSIGSQKNKNYSPPSPSLEYGEEAQERRE